MLRQLTRSGLVRLAALIALVALAAFSAAGAARADTSYVYPDVAGDSASAPDIQQVTLTDNGDGTVGVRINLAAVIADDGSCVLFGIDADRNPKTGDPDMGMEYIVMADVTGAGFGKWDGSQFTSFTHQSIAPTLDGGELAFTLTLADLGVTSFDFVVAGYHADDIDVVPDDGVLTYPQAPAKPTLKSVMVGMSVLMPKAGKKLAVTTVQLRLSDDEIVNSQPLSCTLTYRGKKLPPVKKCTWNIPKSYKGKTLTLNLAVTYQGDSRTISLPVTPQ